jgi:uncharacterized membrane protein
MKRIQSIDFVRGLVMVIMALDHVRDFMHVHSIDQSPTDLATTTPALFFTRWITHLCAPTFVFLAGTSAYLSLKNQGNISESRKFLVQRGFWLIFLEFTGVNFGLWFDLGFHQFLFQVIAAIGFGFILLGLMLSWPVRTIGLVGLSIVFLHNLLPLIPFAEGSVLKTIVMPFFAPTAFPITPKTIFIMGYPPIPWLGVMLLGFWAGQLFELPEEKRKGVFLKIGAGALLLFAVLRTINVYGDPSDWSFQKNAIFTALSFLNVTKYPPSLLFCLITLGILCLKLAFAEQAQNRISRILSVYGRVPLFYFLVHFYIIHLLMIAILLFQGFHWAEMDFASGNFGRPKGVESGVGLGAVYLIWAGVVVALYPICKWYGTYKMEHKERLWLRYL